MISLYYAVARASEQGAFSLAGWQIVSYISFALPMGAGSICMLSTYM